MQFTDTEALVPLALLAAEHGQPVEQFDAWLQRRGLPITINHGLRCVPTHVAQQLHDEREAARQAAIAERQRRAGQVSPIHARLAAIGRRQDELRAAGLDLDGVSMMLAVSGELDNEAAADHAGRELMARAQVEALDDPKPPAKPESPFTQLGLRR